MFFFVAVVDSFFVSVASAEAADRFRNFVIYCLSDLRPKRAQFVAILGLVHGRHTHVCPLPILRFSYTCLHGMERIKRSIPRQIEKAGGSQVPNMVVALTLESSPRQKLFEKACFCFRVV